MGNKLVKNLDDILWKQFTTNCKSKKRLVGAQLGKLIEKHLKDDK